MVLELASLNDGQFGLIIRGEGLSPAIRDGLSSWGRDIHLDGEDLSMTLLSELVVPEITRYLVGHGVQVHAITPRRASLEEIFIETVGKDGGL